MSLIPPENADRLREAARQQAQGGFVGSQRFSQRDPGAPKTGAGRAFARIWRDRPHRPRSKAAKARAEARELEKRHRNHP